MTERKINIDEREIKVLKDTEKDLTTGEVKEDPLPCCCAWVEIPFPITGVVNYLNFAVMKNPFSFHKISCFFSLSGREGLLLPIRFDVLHASCYSCCCAAALAVISGNYVVILVFIIIVITVITYVSVALIKFMLLLLHLHS